MSNTQIKPGHWVVVIQNGRYNDIDYRIGEYWQIQEEHNSTCYVVEKEGEKTVMVITDPRPDRNEAKWLGISRFEILQYNIY